MKFEKRKRVCGRSRYRIKDREWVIAMRETRVTPRAGNSSNSDTWVILALIRARAPTRRLIIHTGYKVTDEAGEYSIARKKGAIVASRCHVLYELIVTET
jgi:hypothetical protein